MLGHEAAGEVTELGPGVTRLTAGQRVSVEPGVPDMSCQQCLAGRYNLCPNMLRHASPSTVRSPSTWSCTKPSRIRYRTASATTPPRAGAALGGDMGVPEARVTAGDRGPHRGGTDRVGRGVQAAVGFGATEVIVSDVNPARLALARLGRPGRSTHGRRASPTWSPRGAHRVLGPAAISEAIRALARAAGGAGRHGWRRGDPACPSQERELELTGTFRYANTWPAAIAATDRPRPLVTGTYRLDQAEQALTAGRRDQHTVKVVVHPQT